MNSAVDEPKNSDGKYKLFKDTVHGYIRIPETYCDLLIDTPEFQRLRRIEQTSMRTLYPCARHDRFSHSLGVYHLGSIALQHLKRNSLDEAELQTVMARNEWDKLSETFHIACLLHDIGHAPFSHTFEEYFDIEKNKLGNLLLKEADDKRFNIDYPKNKDAKPHEKLSALILLKKFSSPIRELEADPILAARMIIGCRFKGKLDAYQSVANCLVTLLNGECIDVDRLDYTSRDLWASGVETSTVDLSRLLSSVCMRKLKNGLLRLAFLKNAISVIESVLDVRNFLNVWTFSHHKIKYDQYILDQAVKSLAINITKNRDNYRKANTLAKKNVQKDALELLFSVDSFFNSKVIGDYQIYLPSDDDLIFLMKQEIATDGDDGGYMNSWLYRQHKLKPLWKSYPEFCVHFSSLKEEAALETLKQKVESIVIDFFDKQNAKKDIDYYIEVVEPKVDKISNHEILVDMGGKITSFTDLQLPGKYNKNFPSFFYIYLAEGLLSFKQNLIDELIEQSN